VKKILISIFTLALLALSAQPEGVLAAENGANANISQNTETIVQIEPAPLANPETVQERLKGICEDNGYGEACAKDLFGILMQESRGNANALGDHGMAYGWFQINRYYNPNVTVACAVDLDCSAEWTLKHLESKGYPTAVNRAILCHNGCGISKTYVANVHAKAKAYWSQPMLVTAELAKN